MYRTLLFLLLLFISHSFYAQDLKVNNYNSHKDFVATLVNSKEARYSEIIEKYDRYIKLHPKDIIVQIYKCKFIGNAYYDEYEDYNLKYEETEACINYLYTTYPENIEVNLYKLENIYGDEREALLDTLISWYRKDATLWTNDQTAILFNMAANYYDEKDDSKAIRYSKLAEQHQDTLDLSLIKAEAYLRLDDKENARKVLLENIEKDHHNYILNRKGELLITLNEEEEALKLYDFLEKKDSTVSYNENLYLLFLNKKNYVQARTYLVNDTITTWNKMYALQKLANHDLQYSKPELALTSLRRLQRESYFDDLFSIKRIRLAFRAPTYFWNFTEISHVFILIFSAIILLFLPYLWILPIYFLSHYFKFEKIKRQDKLNVSWTLKHFWIISFLYILTQFIISLIYDYQNSLNYYFDILDYYSEEVTTELELISSNSQLIFCGLLLCFTLLLVNKLRLKFILHSNATIRQIIGLSILFLVFNGFVLKILGQFVDLTEGAEFISALSAKEEIHAMLSQYGLNITILVVALIVPFYEEIIFRGIILSSIEKHIGFISANVIQAFLFAVVHFNFSLFIFYFIFGIVTGYFVRRTSGLLTGISFHAINNLVVVLSMYYLSTLL